MLKLLEQAEMLCLKLSGHKDYRSLVLLRKATWRYNRRMDKAIHENLRA